MGKKNEEPIVSIDVETGEPIIEWGISTLERFSYESGYLLEGIDLGAVDGVKIVLSHPQYETATIVLNSDIAEDFAFWLLKTMGQKIQSLPNKLPITIKGILDQKGQVVKLQRGDRQIFEGTMDVLRNILYHKEIKQKNSGE